MDYLIVGAGSAGCVLASRLSEDPDVRVGLVEAGASDGAEQIHTPAAFPELLKSGFDWDLLGEPEPGLGMRRLYLPRGRVIGGSSSINGMIYVRGNRADFDEWESLGFAGWGYEDVLPYFKRSEDNERGGDAFHGVGGPLAVSDGRSLHPLVDSIITAATEAGHEVNPDFNGARQEGVGRFQLNQREGRRCSAADAFLHPISERPNLEVITNGLVTRILFEGHRAVGVEFVRSGRLEQLRVEREVIVSAGSYQSPVLLMLSGIGPAEELEAVGIDVRENLPVGHNLQDHCMVNLNFLTDRPSLHGTGTAENLALFEKDGRGPLTSNIPEGGGFFRTRPGLDAPDIEFHMAPTLFYDEALSEPEDHGYTFGPVLLKPAGRGTVRLRTVLPDSKPRVLCNFLTSDEDRDTMVAGVRLALEIGGQPALSAVKREAFSAPASDSEKDIMDFIRRAGQTVYHPTSTCAMGEVVDAQMRVYGIDGLRVVDASVMPTITRGNTHAPTVMLAEKASDLIKERPPLRNVDSWQGVANQ